MASPHESSTESVMMADVEGVCATEVPQREVIPFVGGLVAALERDAEALAGLEIPATSAD